MMIKSEKNNKGFTLIELLTVIAIIGLLATLGMTSISVARDRANISNAQHDLDQIFKAITLMQSDTDQWPGHQVIDQSCIHLAGGCPANNEICEADANAVPCVNSLVDDYSGLLADHITAYPNWAGPYLKVQILEDPWGNEYFLDTDYSVNVDNEPCGCSPIACQRVAALGSYGPDGIGISSYLVESDYGCDDIILIIGR